MFSSSSVKEIQLTSSRLKTCVLSAQASCRLTPKPDPHVCNLSWWR